MQVWMFVDPNSSQTEEDRAEAWNAANPNKPPRSAVEMEYAEIMDLFARTFPAEQIEFKPDVLPHALQNAGPEFYVFDIGGMDFGGTSSRRRAFSNALAQQVREHPDTTFVPWSAFTHRYAEGALEEMLLGDDPDAEWKPKEMLPPNILVLDSNSCYDGLLSDKMLAYARQRYQARKRG